MSDIPEPVARHIAEQGWGDVTGATPVGGGSISDCHVLTTRAGPRLFLKLNGSAPADMFEREAEGLAALATASGAPRVPAPVLTGADFLLLEYIPSAPPAADYWAAFGQRLARLHSFTNARFGFAHANYIGSTTQPNPWTDDGYVFFAKQRLLFQAGLAHQGGRLSAKWVRRIEVLADKLPTLIPFQAASLLHGDLWGGNAIPGPDGQACLIDPAAHFGWAEADLAMTTLFGRPPQSFYTAYAAERLPALEPGYAGRFDLYNLYHLLNHLNLFGASYLGSVEGILARYA